MALNDTDGMTNNERLSSAQSSSTPRRLVRAGMSGGTASDDSEIEVYAGDYLLCRLKNLKTTGELKAEDLIPVHGFIPANTKIIIKCSDAMPDNCFIGFEIKDLAQRNRRRGNY